MGSSGDESPAQSGVDQGSGPQARRKTRGIFGRRFVLAVVGLTVASAALWYGKLDGTNWVYALAVVLAGHNAEDIAKAIRR